MNQQLVEQISKDRSIRRVLTGKSHYLFFNLFLSHYAQYDPAFFHNEMFALTEGKDRLVAVMAFRGSGKSTVMNLSYALWAILGIQEKKFVLIISKTQSQAKSHFLNIKRELESNALLKSDMGPFSVDGDEWGMHSLVIPHLEAKIVCACRDQGVRGMRHGTRRPDLIICDDVEDSVSVKAAEEREATYRWFMDEVFPAGEKNTKIVVLGNLLHGNSFMMRLKKMIEEEKIDGVFRAYPLLDDDGRILWPERFPNSEAIRVLKQSALDETTWEEEYLLRTSQGEDSMPCRMVWDPNAKRRKYDWDEKKFPPRFFKSYRISAPVIRPSITIIMWLGDKDKPRP